jgi:hypothetical protein
VVRPQLQHGNGGPLPIVDGPSTGNAPVIFGPLNVGPSAAAAKAADPAPAASAVVTPLALTPGRDSVGTVSVSNAAQHLNVTAVAGEHDAGFPAKTTSADASQGIHLSAPLAAVAVGPTLTILRAADAVPATVTAVKNHIEAAEAVVAGVEGMGADMVGQSLPAQVAYNFIRFDAANFQDAVATFANELASLTKPAASRHSTLRAWIVTGTVLVLDAVLLGYMHHKSRQRARLAMAKVLADLRRHRTH